MRYRSRVVAGSPTIRLAAVVAATAVLAIAIAGAVVLGASPEPPITGPIAPTWVTGHVYPAPSCKEPAAVSDGGVLRSRDVECSPQSWTSSDARLTGAVSRRWNSDIYQTDEGSISVGMDAAYLRNEGGGWACSASYVENGYGRSAEAISASDTFTCIGDGGYAGLAAILVLTDAGGFSEDLVGLIFSGGFPPLPEPPAAE
jgi:hypothetical protein